MESDSDSDEERQMQELQQLSKVIRADDAALSSQSSQSTSLGVPSSSSSTFDSISNHETAIALNKLLDEKYKRLEKVLKVRLSECEKRLEQFKEASKESLKLLIEPKFRYINCGKPYFRDANNFPAPNNEDTIVMSKAGMIDLSMITSVPGWTIKDKSQFLAVLLDMSKEYKAKELKSKMAQLKRDAKVVKPENLDKSIKKIKIEIEAVKKKSLNEIAMGIEEEYDWDLIATRLNRRHSAQEYQSLWKLFLHPSINKAPWTKAEHVKLLQLASENNNQDWDKIAKELNTGRTGYQCFVYFRTNTSNAVTGQKWTKEEEEYLKRLIEYYRQNDYIPWNKIAASMDNRTKIQIYNKYATLNVKRKGRFLPEEDSVIMACVNKYGKNYTKIAEYLPGRSAKQIQVRHNILDKTPTVSVVWTPEEDRKLVQIISNSDTIVNYASITQYFPGKNRFHIRSRYMTLQKWMKRHPMEDIAKAPRRLARRLTHGQADLDIKNALEKLKLRMETDVKIKRSKRITIHSTEKEIEDSILATLVNEINNEKKTKELEDDVLEENPVERPMSLNEKNLHRVLLMLRAKLNKETFEKEKYHEKYPGLLSSKLPSSSVRSYSKKAVTDFPNAPDIWGERPLRCTQYFLPPNYDTITGCRRIIKHVGSMMSKLETAKPNLAMLEKNNVLIREQKRLLMERFSTLFLWPMMLSTTGPIVKEPQPIASTSSSSSRLKKPNHRFLPKHWVKPQFQEKAEVNDQIDLKEPVVPEEAINISTLHIDNDDYMFLPDEGDNTVEKPGIYSED